MHAIFDLLDPFRCEFESLQEQHVPQTKNRGVIETCYGQVSWQRTSRKEISSMIVDEELKKKQVWVAARMKQTERSSTTVYFPAVQAANLGWWEVGDAPPEWNGENPDNRYRAPTLMSLVRQDNDSN